MIPHPCFAPHHRGTALAALTLLAALAAFPTAARAQSDAQKEEARDHADKARRSYDVGKYGDAIEEYQKVYLLTDDPKMLFNIGQCYRLTDRPEEAVRFYRNYLRRAPANAPNRADVETKIAALEKVIEERRRSAPTVTAPPPATAGPTEPAVAPPPPPPPSAVVTPPPVTAQPPPVVTESAPPPPSRSGARVAGYVLTVTGAALIATSAISGAVAAKKGKDLTDLSRSGGTYDPALQSSGKAANAVAVVSGLLGVAAAATGAILLFTTRSTPAVAGVPRPPAVQVALFPLAGPQMAGGGAQVTF